MNDISQFHSWFDGLTTNGPVKEFMTHYTSACIRIAKEILTSPFVIPAEAGIQIPLNSLDSGSPPRFSLRLIRPLADSQGLAGMTFEMICGLKRYAYPS